MLRHNQMVYVLIARIFGMACDLFYRRRHLGGQIPDSGPVLLVANHPNGLIDPVVIVRVAPRTIRFLAKAPLFKMPILGWLITQMRALPIYRKKDGHNTKDNRGTFDAVSAALASGDCVCLFPEGISHDEPQLQPLKTGAARMALAAEADHAFKLGLRVVPIGLTYRDKSLFRGEVAVQIGDPLSLADLAELHHETPREAVKCLTERIDHALRDLTVNLDAWDDLPLLDLAGRIWSEEDDPAIRLRLAADAHRDFLARSPASVARVRTRLLEFQTALTDLGIKPDELERDYKVGTVSRFAMRNLAALFIGLPAAILGAIAYFIPYYFVRVPVTLLRPTEDVIATYKLLASMLFFGIWHIGLTIALTAWLGAGWGVLWSIGLPFCAIYTHHFIERRQSAVRELALLIRLPFEHRLRTALRAERDAIRTEIESLTQIGASK